MVEISKIDLNKSLDFIVNRNLILGGQLMRVELEYNIAKYTELLKLSKMQLDNKNYRVDYR